MEKGKKEGKRVEQINKSWATMIVLAVDIQTVVEGEKSCVSVCMYVCVV